jgi:hypothetical protein
VLTHTDVLELLGPRPFEMSDNYKEFVDTNHQWASRIKVPTPEALPSLEGNTLSVR